MRCQCEARVCEDHAAFALLGALRQNKTQMNVTKADRLREVFCACDEMDGSVAKEARIIG